MKKIFSAIMFLSVLFMFSQGAFAKSKKQERPKHQRVEQTTNEVKDAQYYLRLGADYEWKNNRAGAIDVYTKALEIDPDCNEARAARVKLCYFLGRYEEALEDLEYFRSLPDYGPAVYYDYRINSKLKLGRIEDAVDDMYEVIIAYGGQSVVLKQLFETIEQNPELEYKLDPKSHPELLEKYSKQARFVRDYAQMYKGVDGKVTDEQYYNFFVNLAKALDPAIIINVEYIQPAVRTAPAEAETQTIDINEEQAAD